MVLLWLVLFLASGSCVTFLMVESLYAVSGNLITVAEQSCR